jgi:hypothetical protein
MPLLVLARTCPEEEENFASLSCIFVVALFVRACFWSVAPRALHYHVLWSMFVKFTALLDATCCPRSDVS